MVAKLEEYKGFSETNTFIRIRYESFNIMSIRVTRLFDYTMKEIMMFFLLHLNEDFDDDLLQDAIEILE
jgi:hypothetical protein